MPWLGVVHDDGLMGKRRTAGRVAAIVAGVVLAGLGITFAVVGLDKADKVGSVVGALTGLLGVAVAVYSTWFVPAGGGSKAGQLLSGSNVGRDVIQIRGVKGGVRIKRGTQITGPIAPSQALPPGNQVASPNTAQAIDRSTIAGQVVQADGVDGDLDVDQ